MISGAAHQAKNVVGIVFVASFVPEESEVLGEVAATSKDKAFAEAIIDVDALATSEQQSVPEAFHAR